MQESGVPNIWGNFDGDRIGAVNGAHVSGPFNLLIGRATFGAGFDTSISNIIITFNSNRVSNQYITNLNEVRVKSIISNGYIRIF